MPVTIDLTPELESRLRHEAARQGLEPEAYIARTLEQHLRGPTDGNGSNGPGPATPTAARPEGTRLSAEEAELLREINLGLPPDFWSGYRHLLQRRDQGSLTPQEQASLVAMSDRVEEANARRMTHLARLARIRGVSLEALMRDLGVAGAGRD